MDLSLTRQTVEFMLSAVLGAGLGFVYDIVRLIRANTKAGIILSVVDVLFWNFAAALVFWFAMTVQDGELRIFSALGALIGAVIYFLAPSKLVLAVGLTVTGYIRKILRAIFTPLRKAGRGLANFIKKAAEKKKKHFQSARKKCIISWRKRRFLRRAWEDPQGGRGNETQEKKAVAKDRIGRTRGIRSDKFAESANGHKRGSPGAGGSPRKS